MVKQLINTVLTEEYVDSENINENGKRPSSSPKTESKKRLKTKSWYRQPTANELNRLQETETLFNSNIFRLQVEEVLEEVKVCEKTAKKLQQWLEEIKKHLDKIPEDSFEYDLTENTLSKKLKVKLPITDKLYKTKCMFKFHKFGSVDLVGSYSLGCPINSRLQLDLQITVPPETYTKNDSVNYKYHKKRAAYLVCIVSHLMKLDCIEDLSYSCPNTCETKPFINFKPKGKLGNKLSARILLTCDSEAYKLHRFSPVRNNLRGSWLFTDIKESDEVGPPTPYYNSTILSDLTASANHNLLKETLKDCENLKQAIVLIKIWLRQRNLLVSGHIVSLFLVHLVQLKRINNIMSSYQIVRNIWIAWKSSEWDKKGISLQKASDSTPALEEFHQHFPVVFLDRTGYYNICWQMSVSTYMSLKRESALAVEMLDDVNINSFTPLFMTPMKKLLQFDHILRFRNPLKVKEVVTAKTSRESRLSYGVDEMPLVINTLLDLLMKGLGERAELIQHLDTADFSWNVKKTPEKAKSDNYEESISFGFILNSEKSLNNVEKGPAANLPEAEEFRMFWGDKSELRRFQDGSITETCVWDGDTMVERRTITRQIIDYLLQLKYDIGSAEVYHVCEQLDAVLASKQHRSESEELSQRALVAFDALRRDLRALTHLPLDVTAVYGISPVFSYSDPVPPAPCGLPTRPWKRGSASLIKEITKEDGTACVPQYTPVSRAVLELGHSGKWPGDLQAFRCLKAAFHLQISDRLQKEFELPSQAYPSHIDVMKEGFVFRLAIAHPKEITLLRREMENGVVKFKESEESVNLQCESVLLPRLRGALHGLHSRYPAYGPACCLLKRWLCSHLLSPPHFPSVVVELVMAAVFRRPHPAHPPATPLPAFLRALRLLADTDWANEMILLDFNNDMKREEILELERKFCALEEKPALHIVTSYDGDLPGVWSQRAPSKHVLARSQALAISALNYMETALGDHMKDNVLGMFIPSLSGYDVLIHLRDTLVPYSSERVSRPAPPPRAAPPPRDVTHTAEVIPVVEFDPVALYLQELRSAYGEFALFFHDACGGDVIAVLWKPDIHEEKEFQALNANALKPVRVKDETKYRVNVDALVQDFRILGKGLVKDITVT